MTAETRTIFEKAWGKAGMDAIKVVDAEKLLDTAWADSPTWALVPFENLEPRWKVLKIEGLSPLDRSFDIQKYALTVRFGITGLPEALAALKNEPGQLIMVATNRDSEHMTVLMLTGTTAMVRYMALRMEENGVLYPVTDIRDEFSKADVVHISNEVPFYEKCPPAKPVRREMRFCSAPNYFDLLKAVGTDIVELTGNHELDWGYDPMLYTLDLYDKNGIKVYGGGKNDAEARKPLLFEDHGNKLAFIGCSPAGPENVWATQTEPGSAKCDYAYIEDQVKNLLGEGYLPIFTFQHFESDDIKPRPMQRSIDFLNVSEMGVPIVSGSESHTAQTMTFKDGRFIHYGLGNTFFDQMDELHRPAFLDRHVIYEGRYISTELITTILEDYARPRLMTAEERQKFLKTIFDASVWK